MAELIPEPYRVFVLLHLGAGVLGLIAGLCITPSRSENAVYFYLISGFGAVLAFAFSIQPILFAEPRIAYIKYHEILLVYAGLMLVPFFVAPSLLLLGGYTVGQVARHILRIVYQSARRQFGAGR